LEKDKKTQTFQEQEEEGLRFPFCEKVDAGL
jgi:hypothetical protein